MKPILNPLTGKFDMVNVGAGGAGDPVEDQIVAASELEAIDNGMLFAVAEVGTPNVLWKVTWAIIVNLITFALSAIFAPIAKGVTNGDAHDHSGGDGAAITEAALSLSDLTAANASTTAHGFSPKATAPASGVLNVLAIANGETVRTDKAIFDSTNPAALGTAAPGTQVVAARRDHVHAVANDSISYAQIQNVSATDKVLGRSSAGEGDIEEITMTSAGRALVDDATAADQRSTLTLGKTEPVADDAAISFSVPYVQGILTITRYGTSANSALHRFFGWFRCSASVNFLSGISVGTSTDTTTGALTGTTGSDGKLTVSVDNTTEKIYIENRTGGALTIYYSVS